MEPFLSCLIDEDNNLVDGYHRYTAAQSAGKRKINAIFPLGPEELERT